MLAGVSVEERARALATLSKEIGLDLGQPGRSYALVRCSRHTGTATYPSYATGLFRHKDPEGTLQPDTLEALKKLEKTSQDPVVSTDGAKGYLDFYKMFGTHFISAIKSGDTLFQVSFS